MCFNFIVNNLCVNIIFISIGKKIYIGEIVVIVFGVVVVLVLVVMFLWWWWWWWFVRKFMELLECDIDIISFLGFVIIFEEIMVVIVDLSDSCVIGRGGYGVVYKVRLVLGMFIVVKKIDFLDKFGIVGKSFLREIEMVGNVKY